MCGRFTLTRIDEVEEFFGLDKNVAAEVRYNIAPSQKVLAITSGSEGQRSPHFMEWGLIPSWNKNSGSRPRLINARAETVARKRPFRDAFESRRCLIPADGFFEWRRGSRFKEPYYFTVPNPGLFAFAGVWDFWVPPGHSPVQTLTILTTHPNILVSEIHNRMPVILDEDSQSIWLNQESDQFSLQSLFLPFPVTNMTMTPVNKAVNKVSVDSPLCIQRQSPDSELDFFSSK
jgi:putative SOS response-associated peptidase YedK